MHIRPSRQYADYLNGTTQQLNLQEVAARSDISGGIAARISWRKLFVIVRH